EPEYPLWLFSNSTEEAQSSQWVPSDVPELLPATVHPAAATGFRDGQRVRLVSAVGAIVVRLQFDTTQRTDVVLVPKGGHYDRGQSANSLIRARLTDGGGGAAYLDTRVRLEPFDS
ncbi:MAG TPA: molybdopterin dinucleotide binding domain-containing protein, partial [Candidatus Xenobia bacterium]